LPTKEHSIRWKIFFKSFFKTIVTKFLKFICDYIHSMKLNTYAKKDNS